jgi:5-methylcytosine-specific restriction protein A
VLCDARVERLVLAADGRIVDLTSFTEQITAAQRRAVAARDRCCTAKGCSRPPAFCDVHHLRARADGGPTAVDNLVLLCRRHHVMWHRQQLGLADLRVPWMRPAQPRAPSRT